MAWRKATVSEFLIPRQERFKANDPAIAGIPRIDKIDFLGNIVISQKPSKTDMILIHPGDFVISGINVAKGAMAVYQGKEPVKATIHYSSYSFNHDVINLEYFKRFLKSPVFIKLLKEQVSGGIKTEIKPKHLLPLIIDLPEKNEQETILSRFLNTEKEYSGLISEIAGQKELLKKYRQAILQEAIEGKLTTNWRKANPDVEPASKLLDYIADNKNKLIQQKKRKKQKPLPSIVLKDMPFDIPVTWQWCRLGDLSKLITSGSRGWAKYYSEKGAKFIRMGNLSKNTFQMRLDKIQHVKAPKTSEGTRTRLSENDILMSVTGDVGALGLVPPNFGEAYINQHTGLIRLYSRLQHNYFAFALLSHHCQKQCNAPQRGVKNSFRLSDIEAITIPLPPLDEQKAIIDEIAIRYKLSDKLEAEIAKTQTHTAHLITAIMQEVFDVSELNLGADYETMYPATDVDNAICGVGLEISKQVDKISSTDQLAAMLLATHPEWCNPLLTETDITALNKAIKSAPKDMFVSNEKSIGWKECCDYLELRNAINVSRVDTDQNITKGDEFKTVYTEFANDMSKIVSLALKALDKMSELRQKLDSANEEQKKIIKLFDLKWQEQKQELEAA